MPLTAIEKILMNHSVDPITTMSPGDIVTARLDYAGVHEGVDARKFALFTELGEMTGVFDPEKFGIFYGHHFCTAHSDELAENYKKTRDAAEKLGIKVYDFGTGIAHVIVMEQGLAYPGALRCLRGFPCDRLRGGRSHVNGVRDRDAPCPFDGDIVVQGSHDPQVHRRGEDQKRVSTRGM